MAHILIEFYIKSHNWTYTLIFFSEVSII